MVEAADRLNEAEATAAAVPAARRRAARPRARRARVAQHPRLLPAARDGAVGLGARPDRVRPLRRAGPARHVRRPARRHGLPRLRARRAPRASTPETARLLQSLHGGRLGRTWMPHPPASRAAASGLIAAYAQWHLERGIRSLEHVVGAPGAADDARSRSRTAMPWRTARSTGPGCTRRPSRRARCPSTSRSSWTATGAGRTGAGSRASRATRPARPRCSTSSPVRSRRA